jgi:FdhE protein
LATGGAGPAAERIAVASAQGALDVGPLLAATLSRNVEMVRAGATQMGLVPDLLWLVAELAVSPFGHALQQQVLGASRDETLIAALDGWDRGYCPACGSWPALAEARQGRTILRCSFCALAWEMARNVCPFCATDGDTLETVVAEPATAAHATLCTACASYLKVIDVTELSPFPLLAIAEVETMSLDIAAMERGYTRPAIHEYRRPNIHRDDRREVANRQVPHRFRRAEFEQ